MWEYASTTRAKASLSCQRPASRHGVAAGTKLVASDAIHTVRVIPAPAPSDVPNRLVVLDRTTNRRIASWPLFERPARVALYGNIATLSGAARNGLYALRISDGRMAQVGIARAGDRPLTGSAGVLYQDNLDLSKHRTAPAERTLNLLPLPTVAARAGPAVLDRPQVHVVLGHDRDQRHRFRPGREQAPVSRCRPAASVQ